MLQIMALTPHIINLMMIEKLITYEKIYNKLVEEERRFKRVLLGLNLDKVDELKSLFRTIDNVYKENNDLHADQTDSHKINEERLKNTALFIEQMYLRKEIKIYDFMVTIPLTFIKDI